MMKSIGLNTVIQRNPSQPFSEIDGEVVMLNVKKEAYFSLNVVGSLIWTEISEPCEVSSLVKKIRDEYDVSDELCFNDIKPFLADMVKAKVIQVK